MDQENLGKYELRGQLGRGAMGTVFEGWDPAIERKVAIKTVRLSDAKDAETQDQIARFRREAQAAGRLQHPNVVGVFDYGETADLAYIVMEFVDGGTLKDILDRQERFAPAETIRIMEQLLAGLNYSHERGIVHRDIKPANVMLTRDGGVKIADFGIARIESSSMTQAGTVLGTPAYMSPEQFMGQTVDSRTDIYSSGVLLYHLLTGERPFEGSMTAIMHKALNTEPPKPSELSVAAPRTLDAVVAKAMAKRPADRFETAQAFARALQLAMSTPEPQAVSADPDATMVSAPRPAPPNTPPPPAPAARPAATPAKKSSAMPIAAAAVVVLAVAGGAGFFVLGGGGGDKRTDTASVTQDAKPAAAPDTTVPPVTSTAQPNTTQSSAASPAQPSAPVSPPAQADTPPPMTNAAASSAPATSTAAPASQPPGPAAQGGSAAVVKPPPAGVQPATGDTVTPAAATPPTPPSVQTAMVTPPPQPALPPAPDLRAIIAQARCALVTGDENGSIVELTGVAQHDTADQLHRSLDDTREPNRQFHVQAFDGPEMFCQALETLRVGARPFGQPQRGLQMALSMPRPGQTKLVYNDQVMLDLTAPEFGGWLQVDYLENDSQLSHMLPSQLRTREMGPMRVSAGEKIRHLFAPSGKYVGYPVDVPYGIDMIIAVVSSEKLFPQPRPENPETDPASYISALQSAIDAAQRRGVRVAAAAVLVPTAAH